MSSKPRIKPADAEDGRPVSISARLGRLQFHYSGKFRVLQIADIQDGPKVSKDTITLIEASLDATRPDLVIFSGNQIAGYDPAFADSFRKRRWCDEPIAESALNHTRALVRKAIGQFTEPLAARGIPWAVTYGNHDFQCGLSNAELDGIYREFPGCVNPPSETLPNQIAYTCGAGGAVQTPSGATGSGEPGTFALPVMDVDHTRNVLGLVILDSGDYVHGGGFGAPSPAALAFLNAVPDRIGAKSMVFQHMPMPEYYNVLKPVAATSWPSVDGPDSSASRIFTVLSRTPTPEWISPSSLAVVSSTGSDLVKLLFNGSSRESVIIRAIMPSHIVKWQIGEVSHRVAMKLKGRSWMPKRHVWSGTES